MINPMLAKYNARALDPKVLGSFINYYGAPSNRFLPLLCFFSYNEWKNHIGKLRFELRKPDQWDQFKPLGRKVKQDEEIALALICEACSYYSIGSPQFAIHTDLLDMDCLENKNNRDDCYNELSQMIYEAFNNKTTKELIQKFPDRALGVWLAACPQSLIDYIESKYKDKKPPKPVDDDVETESPEQLTAFLDRDPNFTKVKKSAKERVKSALGMG